MYRVSAMNITTNFFKNLSQFIGEMKWNLEKERQDTGNNSEEGKLPMLSEVYCVIRIFLLCGPHGKHPPPTFFSPSNINSW